jgi:hypothetical protein
MPTVLRSGPYRFFFYSGDAGEPSHVHIERDGSVAHVLASAGATAGKRRVIGHGNPSNRGYNYL